MVLGFFSKKTAPRDNATSEEFVGTLFQNSDSSLDSKCAEFLKHKRLEFDDGQIPQFKSFWNPTNFSNYSNSNTPAKLYNEISFNLSSGTPLNNEYLGCFISQLGIVISKFGISELFETSFEEHQQLSGLFYNEEHKSELIERLSYIFLSIRLLCEIYHLSPDEYIKSLVRSQILKNYDIIHLVLTYSTRLPRISYSVDVSTIYSLVEPILAPNSEFFNKSQNDTILGSPQCGSSPNEQNFLVKIIADTLSNHNLTNRIFGTKLTSIASIMTANNGNLLYLLKADLFQKSDDISEMLISNSIINTLQDFVYFLPEAVTVHFMTLLYPKQYAFSLEQFDENIRFINFCSKIPISMTKCCSIGYRLCWKKITSLNQNIAKLTNSEDCLPIIELLCKYYECTTKLVFSDFIAAEQTTELITLCLQISRQPFSEITNKIHCFLFNSLLELHNNGKIGTCLIYLTLINFSTNYSGSDIIAFSNTYTLDSEKCCNFLYNQQYNQFIKSNIVPISYIILKICFNSMESVNNVNDTHISYKGSQKHALGNLELADDLNENNSNLSLGINRLPGKVDIVECIRLCIDTIIITSSFVAITYKCNSIEQFLLMVLNIYSMCLKEIVNGNIDKLLFKELTECIIDLFKKLLSADRCLVSLLFRIFRAMIKQSTVSKHIRKYFEAHLLQNYDIQSQLLYYISIRYFEAINLPLPVFSNLTVHYPAFDATSLNISIFKSYFLGPCNLAKITRRQGTYHLEGINSYLSWQNVLKTHISKLYPSLVKPGEIINDIKRAHHIYIYGSLSSGLYELATNYFTLIPQKLITGQTFHWYCALSDLCSGNLSSALDIVNKYYANKLQEIEEMTVNELWVSRINHYTPQPMLVLWLRVILSLQELYKQFLQSLSDGLPNDSEFQLLIANTRRVIIALSLIESMLSTKSMYTIYAARLYLAKAKLLYHLERTVYQKPANDDKGIGGFMHLVGESMYKVIQMLDSCVIDKIEKSITEGKLWDVGKLSIFWALEFANGAASILKLNEFDDYEHIFTHPTVYFKAISGILNNKNDQLIAIKNIAIQINELALPLPLALLFPRPLAYIPLCCTIKLKKNTAPTVKIEGKIGAEMTFGFNLSRLRFIRIYSTWDFRGSPGGLTYDIRVGKFSKALNGSAIRDFRVIENIGTDVTMFSMPLSVDKLPLGQPCKVLVSVD